MSGFTFPNPDFVAIQALTITEGWASLLAHGVKKFETRDWGTRRKLPIPILITASKNMTSEDAEAFRTAGTPLHDAMIGNGINPFSGQLLPRNEAGEVVFTDFDRDRLKLAPLRHLFMATRGRAVAIGTLTECVEITPQNEWSIIPLDRAKHGDEYHYGFYDVGRWIWKFENVERIAAPFAVSGKLGLWDFHDESRTVAAYLRRHGFDARGVCVEHAPAVEEVPW